MPQFSSTMPPIDMTSLRDYISRLDRPTQTCDQIAKSPRRNRDEKLRNVALVDCFNIY